jgi:type I restriction enzyme R subunit
VLNGKTFGTGLPLEDEKENLSVIIAEFNERLGANFTDMDEVLEQFMQDMAGREEIVLRAKNSFDLFKIIYGCGFESHDEEPEILRAVP